MSVLKKIFQSASGRTSFSQGMRSNPTLRLPNQTAMLSQIPAATLWRETLPSPGLTISQSPGNKRSYPNPTATLSQSYCRAYVQTLSTANPIITWRMLEAGTKENFLQASPKIERINPAADWFLGMQSNR